MNACAISGASVAIGRISLDDAVAGDPDAVAGVTAGNAISNGRAERCGNAHAGSSVQGTCGARISGGGAIGRDTTRA